MPKLLIVTPDKSGFSDFARVMSETGHFEIFWAETGQSALMQVVRDPVDLAVADESLGDMTGLTFAEKLVSVNPMVNCALVSSRPADEFHEITEGLGLVGQLTPCPDENQARDLIRHLDGIYALSANLKAP